ncbi:MAG: uracil-DNA glycosylase [Waddliaceae bacterium]
MPSTMVCDSIAAARKKGMDLCAAIEYPKWSRFNAEYSVRMSIEEQIVCPFEIETTWREALAKEWLQPYLLHLAAFVEKERTQNIPTFPPEELVFNAFYQTPFDRVKVVIMGQDPYHGLGQAHGLSFSVPRGVRPPPSLQNIFKELTQDIGMDLPTHGCLIPWAEQGVMLLNATLTVRQGSPLSHQGKGWERLTDAVIAKLAERDDPVIFVLWGSAAQKKCHHIEQLGENARHVILTASHPSPLSARNGFFGCRHFSKINHLLQQLGKKAINWNLEPV